MGAPLEHPENEDDLLGNRSVPLPLNLVEIMVSI